ncbi:hypothetical protein GJU41_12845 [Bacillus idriensis]|uniref:Uncharacterized protein n=1 Tax=Metabacillus idriensis TaxID=324768 RepID=A0A6I2MGD9_9BACI|nr:hypothetical protein [Metabacillus idriensis]MRX54863.1 hypothetical protein [Metabacillus idriensis]
MQIVIDLHYFVNGVKSLQSGYFKVDVREFKNNPDKEAASVAHEWFRKIKRKYIYEVTLHRALYNEIDITDLLK